MDTTFEIFPINIVPILCALFGFYLLGGSSTIMHHILDSISSQLDDLNISEKPKKIKKALKRESIKRLDNDIRLIHFHRVFHFIGFTSLVSAFLIVIWKPTILAFTIIGMGNLLVSFFPKFFFSWFKWKNYIHLVLLLLVWLPIDQYILVHSGWTKSTLFNLTIVMEVIFIFSFIIPFLRFYQINFKKVNVIVEELVPFEQPNPLDYYDINN